MLTKVLRALRKLRIKVASLIVMSKAAKKVFIIIKSILVVIQRIDIKVRKAVIIQRVNIRIRRAVTVAVIVAVVVIININVLRRKDNTKKLD